MMKRVLIYGSMLLIIAGLVWLNYYLWLIQHEKKQRIEGLQTQVGLHLKENKALADRNGTLLVEVENLRSPNAYYTYEEKAREDYGMIGQNETYFVLPDSELAHLPDVPGLKEDVVGMNHNKQLIPQKKHMDNANTEIIPVSPVPLQLESVR